MDSELLKLRSCEFTYTISMLFRMHRLAGQHYAGLGRSRRLTFYTFSQGALGVNLPGFHIASSRNRIAVSRASGRFVPLVRRSLVDVPYSVEFRFTNVGTDFGLTGGMMFHISSTRYPYEYEFDNDGG
jgi:hypothetical protein